MPAASLQRSDEYPVVEKAWGLEYVLYNGPAPYCLKVLAINPDWQCSLHKHLAKAETFLCAEGGVVVEYQDGETAAGSPIITTTTLHVGDSLHVPAGALHRFWSALPGSPGLLLEASTHHDDEDVVRVETSRKREAL
jgi:mannose-6-phosphate isomerase-like protein (cupin superfamily)